VLEERERAEREEEGERRENREEREQRPTTIRGTIIWGANGCSQS
jgi:hypothetical protein